MTIPGPGRTPGTIKSATPPRGAAWTGQESTLRPIPAANATGFHIGILGAINRFARRLEIPGKDSAGTLLSDFVLLPLRRGI